MKQTQKIKVALVGAGRWGWQHARVFSQHPDVELCAVVGRTEERVRKRAAEFGIRPYTDICAMLDAEKPDLVSLSLPNQEHFEASMKIINAGCPLLVEKPLAFKLDEADQLLAEADKRGLFFAINFNHRYGKAMQLAKEAISTGRIGDVVFATWRFGGEGGVEHPHGNLIETQCHGFDTLEHLCGPIASVSAEMTDMTGPGVYRTLILALRFANGAVGGLIGSYDTSYSYSGAHGLEVNGRLGRLLVQDTVRRFEFQKNGSETSEVWQAGYFNDFDREFHRTFDAHVAVLIKAFKNGQPPPVHARAGKRALLLAHAAIESFETGRRVELRPPVQVA